MSDSGLRSGQVADAAGVKVTPLRYYERRGLLDEPDRTLGGHRLYPPETVTMLRIIKAAQRLGFTLEEVTELLEAGQHRHTAGPTARLLQDQATKKLTEVEARIADLAIIRDTLRAALTAGRDDLLSCAGSPCCPLPFTEMAVVAEQPGRPPEPRRWVG